MTGRVGFFPIPLNVASGMPSPLVEYAPDRPQKTALSRRQIGSLARRRRILQAANQCFARRGLSHTSVERVAVEARVSKALVFTFFGSKGELYETVLGATRSAWTAFADAPSSLPPLTPDNEILNLVRGTLRLSVHVPLIQVFASLNACPCELQRAAAHLMLVDWQSRFESVLRRGISQSLFASDRDCRRVAGVLVDLLRSYLREPINPREIISTTRRAEAAVRIVLRGIAA